MWAASPSKKYLGATWLYPLVLVLVLSCSGAKVEYCGPDNPNSGLAWPPLLGVTVYIDATVSMKGFVAQDEFTNYALAVGDVETIAKSFSPDADIVYYRFGSTLEIIERDEFRKAQYPEFYTDGAISQETRIEVVIDSLSTSGLSIIVTDLFQNESDAGLLVEKLSEKVVSKGLSIALVGVKSEFKGGVFDIGQSSYSAYWDSGTKDSSRLRPFYFLVIGPDHYVSRFVHELEADDNSWNDRARFLQLSHAAESRIATFAHARIPDFDGLYVTSEIVVSETDLSWVKQFRSTTHSDKMHFSVVIQRSKKEFAPDYSLDNMRFEAAINRCDSYNSNATLSVDDILSFDSLFMDDSTIHCTIAISPSKIQRDAVYCIQTRFKPSQRSLILPDWIGVWSMSAEAVRDWQRSTPSEFDGTKTYNLSNLIHGLMNAYYQESGLTIAELCWILKT